MLITCGLLWMAVANSSLFILHSSFLNAQGVQKGKASYYARKFSGRRTASGERLHHDSLTCAHLKYPFGTLLKVTNVLNGKQVVVRVNDRGPYRKGRIIDLSWGAAKAIGMMAQGIVPVTVEKVSGTNIPYKPEEDTLPQFEFELADIDPTGIIPVWQQEVKIDQNKVKNSMKKTATKSEQEVTTALPLPSGTPSSATSPHDQPGTQSHE